MSHPHFVRPRGATHGFDPRAVAQAYNFPMQFTGKGRVCGIIELGGGFTQADIRNYFTAHNLPVPTVKAVSVDGGQNKSDGPDGADGEVLLDIEVAAVIAPNAEFRVYFAANSDQGFLDAIKQAVADKVDVISISWGGPENQWNAATMDEFDAVFKQARDAGIVVFAAAGDAGSGDGESGQNVDFPASSPNVVGCGGTRLSVDATGQRSSETVWNDSTTSATGGGVSKHFPGRQVPDVAGNADPVTGYDVLVDGQEFVIGGTSAVAPLYAGLVLLLSEAVDAPFGSKFDFLNTVVTNPTVCYDVTVGNNGAFRAGPGRDEATGFGVVDGTRLLSVVRGSVPSPAPTPAPVPAPAPVPTPTPAPVPVPVSVDEAMAVKAKEWLAHKPFFYQGFQTALRTWLAEKGL